MSVGTNAVLVCILSLLLSACLGGASASDSAEDVKVSTEVDKILRDYQTGSDTSPQAGALHYLARIQAAILANIDRPVSWQGQKCSVRFTLQHDGAVQDPTVESGDRPFCAQVMPVLKKVSIPPTPDEKTCQTFSHIVLDVKSRACSQRWPRPSPGSFRTR